MQTMNQSDEDLMAALGISSFGGTKQSNKATGSAKASATKAYHGSANSSNGGFFSKKTEAQVDESKHSGRNVDEKSEEISKKRKVESETTSTSEKTVTLPSTAPPAASTSTSALPSLVSYDDSSDEDSDFGPAPPVKPSAIISAPAKIGTSLKQPVSAHVTVTAQPTTNIPLATTSSLSTSTAPAEEPSSDEDEYGPKPIPHIAATTAAATSSTTSSAAQATQDADSDSDDDYGPKPAATAASAAAAGVETGKPAASKSVAVSGEVDWESEGDYSDSDEDIPTVRDVTALAAGAAATAIDGALTFSGTATMPLHTRNVVSLAADRSGSRIYTAGVDGYVHLCDFNRMDDRMKPSKSVLVQEGHPMARVRYSPLNELVLAVTGGQQPVILDRELNVLHTCMKGYPYIMDLSHTKGHKSGCTDGQWHPVDPHEFITCGTDGTVRVWSVAECSKACTTVIKPKVNISRKVQNVQNVNLRRVGEEMTVSAVGNLNGVTACCYNFKGDNIALACVDGSVHVYKHGKKASYIAAEHLFNVDMVVTDMQFSKLNDALLVLRGGEGASKIQVYDTRSKRILATVEGLPNDVSGDMCFHPNGQWLAVALNKRVKSSQTSDRNTKMASDATSASAVVDQSAAIAKAALSMVAESIPRVKTEGNKVKAESTGDNAATDAVVKTEDDTDVVKREDAIYGEDAVYGEDAEQSDLLRHAIFEAEAADEDEDMHAATGQGMIIIVRVSDWRVQAALRTDAPVTTVLWSGYGQLFGGCADGRVECLYDASASPKKGVMLCVGKKGREREVKTDFTVSFDYDNVYSGGESGYLTLHGRVQRPKRGEITKDTAAKPSGSSKGHVNNTSITHQFMKQFIGNTKEAFLQTDPREALLRHAKK